MIRYAIWAAVSTKRQAADDKVSLDEQQRLCRERAGQKGWTESTGPFVVPGESRTRWINLRDAENEIPALKTMLDEAQSGRFDVLVMYDFSRLRELLDPVSRTLSAYNVQLYSLAQPFEPIDPASFADGDADAANILQNFSGMASRAEISALRRRFRLGMPKRVTLKGLHPLGRLPYGYRKAPGREFDRNAPAVPDPITASHVVKAKDLLLAGKSLTQICSALQEMGAATPKGKAIWSPDSLRRILQNPWYYGLVEFGKYKRRRDPRDGTIKIDRKRDEKRIVAGVGVHQPLWDEATHRQIMAEFQRRGKPSTGKRTNRLSRLLKCPICGSLLWVGYRSWDNRPPSDKTRIYLCSQTRTHQVLVEREILPAISKRIADALKDYKSIERPDDNKPDMLRGALSDLQSRRDRLTDAYASGVMALTEYAQRTEQIDAQMKTAGADLAEEERKRAGGADREAAMSAAAGMGEQIVDFILHADTQLVNTQLRNLLEWVMVYEEEIVLKWW